MGCWPDKISNTKVLSSVVRPRLNHRWTGSFLGVLLLCNSSVAEPPDAFVQSVVKEYCLACHNAKRKKGRLSLESVLGQDVGTNVGVWSDVVTALRQREMPPEGKPRPTEEQYSRTIASLELALTQAPPSDANSPHSAGAFKAMVERYCLSCHNAEDKTGGLDLESALAASLSDNTELWEKSLRKIDARQMPPVGKRRPTELGFESLTGHLTAALDATAASQPRPGRTDTFRRLNRTEYQNAIRDLLALEIDAAAMLPPDESSHGFDNVTVGDLPPALLTRYVAAAEQISRLALGSPRTRPDGTTYRVKPDITQESHVPGLPLGTRGGVVLRHLFPRDGEYEIQVRLARDRDELVEGLRGSHSLEILLDRAVVAEFEVAPPMKRAANHFDDSKLNARIQVSAGPHALGVTFAQNGASLEETKRQPLNVHFNAHRHPRLTPAIYEVSVIGPYLDSTSSPESKPISVEDWGDPTTPSRRRVFVARPTEPGNEEAAARRIIEHLTRRAYRRPVGDAALAQPLRFYREARSSGNFETGIEAALSAILVNPNFLFKIERQPADDSRGTPYTISDIELASRLSFFLWSSLPDDELLSIAERGELRDPETVEAQIRRMLADARASALASNFAGQWLHLRNLDSKTPDGRLFPDFDENLRRAFRRETELHFEQMVRTDASVLELIRAKHTYLNERLAKHYGIPHVYGSRFRRVELPDDSHRGGLLRHGSVLTVTSYATRTSPVIRGNWILENILGTPSPPPPEEVPGLDDSVISGQLSVRERLKKHREDPSCARCHDLMDPVGFALENFDAVGRWRELEHGRPVDASGGLPDGSVFTGVAGLESGVLKRPKLFVRTLVEKLLTYGLGRGVTPDDGPAIRRIVRSAAAQNYRFSAIVLGIIQSAPFQMRTSR